MGLEILPKGIVIPQLRKANIGEDYWECGFTNFFGPLNASEITRFYLKNLGDMKDEGVGLLYCGKPGRGKTTLAVIALKYLLRAGWDCYMITVSELIEGIKRGWKDEEEENFHDRCKEADFLLLDDVGKEYTGATQFAQTVFDNLIRYRSQHRKPIFLTTNFTRQEIRTRYGGPLLSVVEGKCKVIVVNDSDKRKEVLKGKIEEKFQ